MKKLLALLLLTVPLYADTTTSNFGMTLPSHASANWDTKLNTNFSIIDSSMSFINGGLKYYTFGLGFGVNALSANTSTDGGFNTAFGNYALWHLTNQTFNTAVGGQALESLASCASSGNCATNDTAVGFDALGRMTQGNWNTVVGAAGFNEMTFGEFNTGLGYDTANSVTSGSSNTLVGYRAGSGSTRIEGVTALGYNAIASSMNTVAIGYNAVASSYNAIAIGQNVTANAPNTAFIGAYTGGTNEVTLYVSSIVAHNISASNITGGGSGGGYALEGATVTIQANVGLTASTATFGSSTLTTFGTNPYTVFNTSGTSGAIKVNILGTPAGAAQTDFGAITTSNLGPQAATHIVIMDSSTEIQGGYGLMDIRENATAHNDPLVWFHNLSSNSAPFIRVDDPQPDMEMVNTSTDNAHGLGKWEPMASPNVASRMQIGNSRCWDNSGFEQQMYLEPLSKGGGLHLMPADSTGCDAGSGYFSSSQTVALIWGTLNNREVGIRGPDNAAASWNWRLPSTSNNGGQVLYQQTDGSPRNWEFTVGGSTGNVLTFSAVGSAPYWSAPTGTPSGASFTHQYKNTGGSFSASALSEDVTNGGIVITTTGGIHMAEAAANGSSYTGFRSSDSLAGSTLWILPDADGSAGDILTTAGNVGGNHNLYWATPTGTSGGGTRAVQYKSGTGFGGSAKVNITSNDDLQLQTTAQLRFFQANDVSYVGLKAPDSGLAGSTVWSLPVTAGTTGQVMADSGSGGSHQLFWMTPASLSASQDFTGGNSFIGAAQSTFTYGVTVGSLTVNGTGAGQIYLTEGASTTVTPASGQTVMWSDVSSHTLYVNSNNSGNYAVVLASPLVTPASLMQWTGVGTVENAHSAFINGSDAGVPALTINQSAAAASLLINPKANVGTTVGTSGGVVVDNSSNTGVGMQLYTSAGAGQARQLWVLSDNSAFGGVQQVIIESSSTATVGLRIQALQPKFELVETDQALGPQRWTILTDNGLFNFYGRTANGGANSLALQMDRSASSNGMYLALQTTGSLRLNDLDNSNYTSIKSSAVVSSNVEITMPATLPTAAGQTVSVMDINGSAVSIDFTDTPTVPLTKAQIGARTPKRNREIVGCTDCTLLPICVSTGTAQGAYSSPVSVVTACN